jgi:hypothetical protein
MELKIIEESHFTNVEEEIGVRVASAELINC